MNWYTYINSSQWRDSAARLAEFKAVVQPFALAGHLLVEVLPAERVGLTG